MFGYFVLTGLNENYEFYSQQISIFAKQNYEAKSPFVFIAVHWSNFWSEQ
jgi:hypothetical protein